MVTHPILVAVVLATAAASLTPWLLRETDSGSRWLTWGTHIPLAALGGAGVTALAATWWDLAGLAAAALACALLIPADLAVHRLPNRIVLPTYAALFAPLLVAAALSGQWGRFGLAAACAAAAFALFFGLALLPSGFGFGDVKLSGVLAGALAWIGGWPLALAGLVATFVLGGLAGVALLIAGRGRGASFAYGPAMIAGTVLAALAPVALA